MKVYIIGIFWLVLSSFSYAVAPSIDDFRQAANIIDTELSPSGRYLAILKNVEQERIIYIHDLENGGNVVSQFGDKIVRPFNLGWVSDNKILVSIQVPAFKSHVEDELEDKHIREIDYPYLTRVVAVTMGKGGWVELLSKKSKLGKVGHLSGIVNILPDDENHVIVSAWVNGRYLLYKAHVSNGKGENIASGGPYTYRFITNRQGQVLYRLDYLSTKKEIIILANQEDDWIEIDRIYYNEEDAISSGAINLNDFSGITNEGELLYLKPDETTGFYALYKRDKKGKTVLFKQTKNEDILGIKTNSYSAEVNGYFTVQDDAIVERSWDEENIKHLAHISAQVKATGVIGFHVRWRKRSSPSVVVSTRGMDNSGRYYLYNKAKKQLSFLAYKNEFLLAENLAIPAKVKYKARDGHPIPAHLLLPQNFVQGKPHATVVMPHGGPFSRDYDEFDPIAQFIATRGYVVIKPNFRGSSGYGKAYEEAGYQQWGQLMQDDVEDSAHFLIKQGITNPNKVCILGISYGGYSALMGALNQDKLFKCAVSVNGVTHLPELLDHEEDKLKSNGFKQGIKELHERIGHPASDRVMLEQNSPALRTEDMNIPILLIGGEKDKIVPFEQQEMMEDALDDTDKDFKFISFEEGRHNPISNYEDIKPFYQEVDLFLKKYLN
ncbi:alpha/beta hydrolase family protein [Algibacillus agarilyticus]|uniref:alpha/beta hydrolase family protein n=1 Tax=Algibacillus agarilyticus TaxID=2234133 RepID=UPI000DD0BCCD|nr:alpha/beta fold hydrolase [Algibacillus agarilyticus]